jgi:hypothetical protein
MRAAGIESARAYARRIFVPATTYAAAFAFGAVCGPDYTFTFVRRREDEKVIVKNFGVLGGPDHPSQQPIRNSSGSPPRDSSAPVSTPLPPSSLMKRLGIGQLSDAFRD